MMMNSFNVDTRLTKKVSTKSTRNGEKMAVLMLANNRGKHCNYFKGLAFGKSADYAAKYLHVGQKVGVTGEMRHTTIKDSDGNYRNYYAIIVRSLDINKDDGSKYVADNKDLAGVNKALDHASDHSKAKEATAGKSKAKKSRSKVAAK